MDATANLPRPPGRLLPALRPLAAWETCAPGRVGAASILYEHRRSRNRNRSRQESDCLALDLVVLARNLTKPILVNSHPGRVGGRPCKREDRVAVAEVGSVRNPGRDL